MISDEELAIEIESCEDRIKHHVDGWENCLAALLELQQHRSKKQVGVELSDEELQDEAYSAAQIWHEESLKDKNDPSRPLGVALFATGYSRGYRAAQQGPRISVEVLRDIASSVGKYINSRKVIGKELDWDLFENLENSRATLDKILKEIGE